MKLPFKIIGLLGIAAIIIFTTFYKKGNPNLMQLENSDLDTSTVDSSEIVISNQESESSDDDWMVAFNNVIGHDEQDQIVGNFTGKGNDTLKISYYYNNENGYLDLDSERNTNYNSYVYSSNPNIRKLQIYYNISPKLVNEGDLDGNGTDEIGILSTWHSSSCRSYEIFTLHKNRWFLITDPIQTAQNLRASGFELAKNGDNKGEIRIKYSNFDALHASCASAEIRDSIVKARLIKYIPAK